MQINQIHREQIFLDEYEHISQQWALGGTKERWGGLGTTQPEYCWSQSVSKRFLEAWMQGELEPVTTDCQLQPVLFQCEGLPSRLVQLLSGFAPNNFDITVILMSQLCQPYTIISSWFILRIKNSVCVCVWFISCLLNMNMIISKLQELQGNIAENTFCRIRMNRDSYKMTDRTWKIYLS